jgi:TolB-like protein/tetratricopeptide (TPR) repeat protein
LLAILLATALGAAWLGYRRAEATPASIAVLPFRNLSAGDSYFADGISEEILDQLTREPAFRVAGPASTAQVAGEADVRKVGRALGVDYILEGSVRPSRDQVRISAALVQTRDGTRLWSQTYDRNMTDILAIQSAIGEAVAGELKRRLVHTVATAPPINGQAYVLYLNARGLLRSDNPEEGQEALKLLRQVIKVNPGFAPAWSSMAEAIDLDARTRDREGLIAAIPQARAAAERALQLDPNQAEAHRLLATLSGGDTPEAMFHQRRAAELDPRSGEGLVALAISQHVAGDFARALASHKRAHAVDPLWSTPQRNVLDVMSELGDRRGAETWVQTAFPDDGMLKKFALARAAYHSGDFSEAARIWSDLAKGETQWSSPSKLSLQNVILMLGLTKEGPSRPPRPNIGQDRFIPTRVWMTAAPSASEWQWRNRSPAAELVYQDENVIAAKLMLADGRARELVATYDSPIGLLGVRRGLTIGTCYVQNAAVVAVALRAVGRIAEATGILEQADAAVRNAYRRGPVPLWLEDDAAGIWALQGKNAQAIGALDRALRRGSMHATRTDLVRLADEPALRSLHGDRRFEALLAKYDARYRNERQETARILNMQV